MNNVTEVLVQGLELLPHARGADAGRYYECKPFIQVNQGDIIAAVDRTRDHRVVGRVSELNEQGWITLDSFV